MNLPISPAPLSRGRQFTLLSALYAAQGLPFGFFTLALPVLLREAGWSLTAISLLQFLALPWAIKFMWAPVLDHVGTRRAWLLGLQCAACASALALSQFDLGVGSRPLFAAVFLFNLIAATQDIVTDGLAVRLSSGRERGLANGIQVGAYRLGMILGGGLLLWLFARTGWQLMFLAMAALLALTILPVFWLRSSERTAVAPRRPVARGAGWAAAWLRRALQPGMLALAGLIFCYRFGDQMVSSLFLPFMTDQGVGKETIALMKGVVGSATSLVGALLGGWLTFKVARRQVLLWGGLAQAACFGLYIAAAAGWGGLPLLWAATVLEGLVSTVATVALFALMMDGSDPEHAGTDYTLLASVVVLVGSLAGVTAGVLGDSVGYVMTFCIGTALAAGGCIGVVRYLDQQPLPGRMAQAWH